MASNISNPSPFGQIKSQMYSKLSPPKRIPMKYGNEPQLNNLVYMSQR